MKMMDIATASNTCKMFSAYPKKLNHILINRVDALGDVVLALPVCGLIKKYYPECRITFLGSTYTKSVALTSIHVDAFLNRDDWKQMRHQEIISSIKSLQLDAVIHLLPDKPSIRLCAEAGIPLRIGARNKLIYWLHCNKLMNVSRKKSRLSEAQLNIKLLPAININEFPSRNEVYQYYGFKKIQPLNEQVKNLLDPKKFNLLIHPFSSKINAKEWGLHNFSAFIRSIDQSRFKVFITGSPDESKTLAPWIKELGPLVTDVTGRFSIAELISFIAAADGLIASSTGPVHIAAASGINTLGLYEDRWTKRGERWGPIGIRADFIQCTNENMDTILPEMVITHINQWKKI